MQTMQNQSPFDVAVERITQSDKRYATGAFYLLRQSLESTLKKLEQPSKDGKLRHVTGKQLALGFRDYVIGEFGPMASTILNEWGVKSCSDLGSMVFLLIDGGVFAKQQSDTPEDFSNHYDFYAEFVEPYLPQGEE